MNLLPWWCELDIRIVHPDLDPEKLTRELAVSPSIAQKPGESKIHFQNCKSAGYWCVVHRVEHPARPDSAILWAERFVQDRETQIRRMLQDGFAITSYLGVHANVMTVGFDMPSTPLLRSLGIPLGIEFYSR